MQFSSIKDLMVRETNGLWCFGIGEEWSLVAHFVSVNCSLIRLKAFSPQRYSRRFAFCAQMIKSAKALIKTQGWRSRRDIFSIALPFAINYRRTFHVLTRDIHLKINLLSERFGSRDFLIWFRSVWTWGRENENHKPPLAPVSRRETFWEHQFVKQSDRLTLQRAASVLQL